MFKYTFVISDNIRYIYYADTLRIARLNLMNDYGFDIMNNVEKILILQIKYKNQKILPTENY